MLTGLCGLKLVKGWFSAKIGQNLQNRVLREQSSILAEDRCPHGAFLLDQVVCGLLLERAGLDTGVFMI